jgi:2-aminoadipate transaminase
MPSNSVYWNYIGMVTTPQLDPALDLPLYRQLYQHIRSTIESGELPLGARLPPTRELAGQLGLNRTTVSAAYDLLEADGLIRGHVGRGSFVSARAPAEAGVSFAASRPAAELFPMDEFRQTCREVLDSPEAAAILQLGAPNGYAPLRDFLLEAAREAGDAGPNDDILVTSGCQQALDLVRRVLTGPRDSVAIEDPVYAGLRSTFQQDGTRLLGIPIEIDGMDLGRLAKTLESERPRLAICTPDFQNPTGTSLDEVSRMDVLNAATSSGTILVENDIYGELRYGGERMRTIKSFDPLAGTILLRSFSKIGFPGLRVGWIIGPREIVRKLAEAKRLCDLHTDQLSQAVMLRFAQAGRLSAHHGRVLAAGAERLKATLAGCEAHLPKGSKFTRPGGGMHLWVRLPGGIDTSETLAKAEKEGVSYAPGRYFAVTGDHSSALRLSFAALEPARIAKGIALLGAVFQKELARAPEPAMV